MKLFTSDVQKAWDEATAVSRQVQRIELIELAANLCAEAILQGDLFGPYLVVSGIGNNGSDGLALARLLNDKKLPVSVLIVGKAEEGSPEFQANLRRVLDTDVPVVFHTLGRAIEGAYDTILVDCIFGHGLNGQVTGIFADAIHQINTSGFPVISIDLPSGMFGDQMSPQFGPIVQADITYALHAPKRAQLFAENHLYVGHLHLLDMSLDAPFEQQQACSISYYTWLDAIADYRARPLHAHKHNLGHGLVIGGSKGKMGAVLLAAQACMRAGSGLCTMHIPNHGLTIAQLGLTAAMVSCDESADHISHCPPLGSYQAIAVGPGLGQHAESQQMIDVLVQETQIPKVWDADALNLLASEERWKKLPLASILTPHIGEFDRLFGTHKNSFERVETQRKISEKNGLIIVLKGHHTSISGIHGELIFNSSGCKGLATAGAGDVLTGLITGLLCQGYSPLQAARLAVFLHGESGHQARYLHSVESMLATDIIDCFSKPFSQLNEIKP